jgi:rubrerythrin
MNTGEVPVRIEQTFIYDVEPSDTASDDSCDEDLSSISSNGESVPDTSTISELEQLERAIHDTVTNLFKISIVIRQPTPRGRYSASKSVVPFDSSFDISHVWHKFPHACQNPLLIERLGKAITRRREYFRYRREHRRRLALERPDAEDIPLANVDDSSATQANVDAARPASTYNNTEIRAPTITLTKATTFIENSPVQTSYVEQADDASLTSYATSTGEGSLYALRVPNPPDSIGHGVNFAYEMPFECPYCFTIQVVANFREWKRHVYRDLQPYICTFSLCASQPFSERHAWFDHELQSHRKSWYCSYCKQSATNFHSSQELERHLRDTHRRLYTDAQAADILQASEIAHDKFLASSCPLCDEWTLHPPPDAAEDAPIFATVAQFRRHLGKHLEQLALFALPKLQAGEGGSSNVDTNHAIADENSAELSEKGFLGAKDAASSSSHDRDSRASHTPDRIELRREQSQGNSDRDMMFCHECAHEWYRNEHGLTCPKCGSDFTELVSLS